MVRFLHTADVQLGMKANDATNVGDRLRDARLETLARCVQVAKTEEMDFVVVAGDLFESNQVSALTVSRAVQIMQNADPTPVYVLPGNHDWSDAASVYERADFARDAARNVVVLSDPVPLRVSDDCVLYPCPLTRRWGLDDPTDWIPARGDETRVRIGVAHGSLPTPGTQREFPIERDTAKRKGLDYLALGDWHSMRIDVEERLAYPGTPEQTSFAEERAGHVLVVEIEGAGGEVRIEPHQVGRLTWLNWERSVSSPASECVASLQGEIEMLPDGPNTLLRLVLKGAVRADELPLVGQLETWLQARCDNRAMLYAEVRNQLQSTETLEGALRGLSELDSVIAGTTADLRRMAAVDEGRPECVADVPARGMDELISSWTETAPGEHEMSVVAREALKLLAELAGEVM